MFRIPSVVPCINSKECSHEEEESKDCLRKRNNYFQFQTNRFFAFTCLKTHFFFAGFRIVGIWRRRINSVAMVRTPLGNWVYKWGTSVPCSYWQERGPNLLHDGTIALEMVYQLVNSTSGWQSNLIHSTWFELISFLILELFFNTRIAWQKKETGLSLNKASNVKRNSHLGVSFM